MTDRYHIAFGVYGILTKKQKLLVIKKNGGPYTNRYDLPGGSLEDGEQLSKAILREFNEETGIIPEKVTQLGISSFKYPWQYKNWKFNQHIAVFYSILSFEGASLEKVNQFDGQDSLGSKFVDVNNLNINNSSPLVLKAKEYVLNGGNFCIDEIEYKNWKVLKKPVF